MAETNNLPNSHQQTGKRAAYFIAATVGLGTFMLSIWHAAGFNNTMQSAEMPVFTTCGALMIVGMIFSFVYLIWSAVQVSKEGGLTALNEETVSEQKDGS